MLSRNTRESNLFIDKVAFTLPIQNDNKMSLLSKISSSALNKHHKIRVYGNSNGRYNNNYQVEIHGGNTVELALYPINTNHNFMRLEYNPAKLGEKGLIKLREFLILLLGIDIVETIYFRATVTRLDLTLDTYDMEQNVYLHKSRVTESEIYWDAQTDNITSQVVGSQSSRVRVTMYDKNIELAIKGKQTTEPNCQRIEIRFRDLNCPMDRLSSNLTGEFEDLSLFSADFLNDSRFTKSFRNRAYNKGLNFALNREHKNERRCYMRYLAEYYVHPISIKKGSFENAHDEAFSILVYLEYYVYLAALAA